VRAAKEAGVKHFIWSTLPNAEAISGGKFHVPHFTGKARIEVNRQGRGICVSHVVIAPFYYQNLVGAFGPQKLPDGLVRLAVPLNPDVRCIHMGDVSELGNIVSGAFLHADKVGNGEYLPLVGDFLSFNEIVETLNQQGHKLSVKQVPTELSPLSFPAPPRLRRCLATSSSYLSRFGFLRPIALANRIASRQPTKFRLGST